MVTLLPGVAAGVLGAALTMWLVRHATGLTPFDIPNERSLHDRPVPRGGGLAIIGSAGLGLAGAAFAGWIETSAGAIWMVSASGMLAAVSFVDDHHKVSAMVRFVAHLLAAMALIAAGLGLQRITLPWASVAPGAVGGWVLTVLGAVWFINLYNFMDGMDGFAGGMGAIGFATMGLLGLSAEAPSFALTSFTLAGACAGFVAFNFPPARIFMGDVGSAVLGFWVIALGLWADAAGWFPMWITVLVFSPFAVDATVTLIRRAARGEAVWLPHRTHYYQRLVGLGWGHRKTLLYEYVLMGLCGGSALLAVRAAPPVQGALLIGWLLAYAGLAWAVALLEVRASRRAGG